MSYLEECSLPSWTFSTISAFFFCQIIHGEARKKICERTHTDKNLALHKRRRLGECAKWNAVSTYFVFSSAPVTIFSRIIQLILFFTIAVCEWTVNINYLCVAKCLVKVGGLKGPFRAKEWERENKARAGGCMERQKEREKENGHNTERKIYIFFQSNSSNLIGCIDRRDTINVFHHSLYGPRMPYHIIIIINIHFWWKNST